MTRGRGTAGVAAVGVVVVVVMVVVLIGLPAIFVHHQYFPHFPSPEECREPTEEECLEESLRGSPVWNDPRLLQVVREEFLTPPSVPAPPLQKNSPPLTLPEAKLVQVVRDKVGTVGFLVATQGVSRGVVATLGGSTGLWVAPHPEKVHAHHHSHAPTHFWHTHACLTTSIPYMNTKQQQCFSLSSLLAALGHTGVVDLFLAGTLPPDVLLHSLVSDRPGVIKAVVTEAGEELNDMLQEYNIGMRHSGYGIGNTTLFIFRT
ncbi:uncharacterized protein LOC123511305 [Portunus trituberculatus]|uniref:Uncharacterized protein n=1 Tax=Portunus trituberculatus TaxID=210409 RepID=A0A5B7DZZ9_PORTR|nr:uncharacterized protein LOC123511305 [Portunus trituberculatus]XP_045123017.1 uncharacterized protein LOC123511305 [Portunus trituberculatus]XP_045123018.1 uncharacterized protein LOC123511305 [Portunus trituberculatus]MPC27352.1 hypothetical protein [Portunus trituberculatus]